MNNRMTKRLIWLVVVLMLISVIWNKYKAHSEENMVSPINRVEQMFDRQERLCFGRFLVNIPRDTIVTYGPAEIDGNVEIRPDSTADVADLIRLKLLDIENRKTDFPEYSLAELPLAGKVFAGALPGQKILFGIRNSVSYDIHSYIPIENDLFIYNTNAFPEADEIPLVNKVAAALRVRSQWEIPADPGICIDGGFVAFEPQHENIAIGLRFKSFPDIRISIEARKNQKHLLDGYGLKDLREKEKIHAESIGLGSFFSRIKVLRDEKRELGIWKGEEILTRRPVFKDDTDAHEFRFFSLGLPNNALNPLLDIRLDSGVKGNAKASLKPSITDEEALALWDKIISTIRIRQPSDATSSNEVKPNTPLGTISKSGEACPQTGLWECTDKRRVDGDRRRKFKEGEKIPPVIVTGHISFLRTLIGDVHRVAQVEWKLIAYEITPSVSGDLNANPQQENPQKNTHA